MNWFFLALFPPALWAASNHIDKYLISKYFKGSGGIGVLAIFSALAGLLVLPCIAIFVPNDIKIGSGYAVILLLCGFLEIFSLHLYFWSMSKSDASVVIPLLQTTPIFSYLFGYFFLDEILTTKQFIAAGLILFGALLISFESIEGKIKIKGNLLAMMTGASIINAFLGFVLKISSLHNNYWGTMFWSYLGLVLVGALLILTLKSYRRDFMAVLKKNSLPVIGLNVANEMLSVVGILIMTYASLLAPLVLISVAGTLQPAFVFVFGIILTLLLPHINSESLAKKHLVQRIIAILIILAGSYVLNTN